MQCFRLNFEGKIVFTQPQLQVDFGAGAGLQPVSLNTDIRVQYSRVGIYCLHFIATLQSGGQIIAHAKIHYKGGEVYDIDYALVERKTVNYAITLYNSYAGGFFTPSAGIMTIYYANAEKELQKPILIVDGFDPGNVRQFDSYTGSDPNGKSIWKLLLYDNDLQHVGDQLRNLGYDLVILDFPDGGGYIESNALVCIQAINDINEQLQANGSKEEIVIVGPSMGGQITRYALRYIENHPNTPLTNYGKHNCRLWISFDSPHQGANISIGGQAFMHFFGYIGGKETAKTVWNNTINCPAAKQMLINQYNMAANSIEAFTPFKTCTLTMHSYLTNPYYLKYYQNLRTIGYPQNLRKIAVTNGNLTGNSNLTGCAEAIELDTYLNVRVSKIQLFPSNGTCEIFYGMFTTAKNITKQTKLWIMADAIANYCSIDAAPGGTYNTFKQIKDAADDMDEIKNVTLTNANHCFMPYTSTLDISGNMNYCTNISNMNLVNLNRTPFQSYCGPGEAKNMEHVEFNQHIVDYLLNEIETYIKGPKEMHLCEMQTYSVNLPDNAGNVATHWTCSPNLRIVSGQGTVNVTVQCISLNGNCWVNAQPGNLNYDKKLKPYSITLQNPFPYPVAPTEIAPYQDAIWNGTMIVDDTVHIRLKGKLTISSTIYCSPKAIFLIHKGGQLIVDGGTLTSLCNTMWQGIVVEGDPKSGSFRSTQGFLELCNNATIANAVCGVTLNSEPDLRNGRLRAAQANFVNNNVAIAFKSEFPPNNPPVSDCKISSCLFEINSNYLSGAPAFNAHVDLRSVFGPIFTACTFKNERNSGTGTGINAINASFSVYGCHDASTPIHGGDCPEADLTHCTFQGFNKGISITGTATNATVRIDKAAFDNNIIGVYVNAINNVSILRSLFNLGNAITGLIDNKIFFILKTGVHLFNSTGFRVEENCFIGSLPNAWGLYGVVVQNSGGNNNEIYKNRFENLTIGQQFVGVNRGNYMAGLKSLCNTHTNIASKDIDVIGSRTGEYLSLSSGIAYHQAGYPNQKAAGNSFSTTATLNYNNSVNPIIYYYHANTPSYYPTITDNPNCITLTAAETANDCPSKNINLSPYEQEDIEDIYNVQKSAHVTLQYNYNQLIDGGNTEALLNAVQGEWSDDVWRIRQELIRKSPYTKLGLYVRIIL